MKKILFLFWLILSFFLSQTTILASDRNIFGLHLTQVSDIDQARTIINSGGGDWGWATIVLRTDLLDHQAWQTFMDNCRKDHIIPIVRLATIQNGDNWKQPSLSDIDNLANFLNSLNWPTKTQYVIPFNEINHASEWGGSVDIQNFTDMFVYASQKLKSLNPNFFILATPLDQSAPQDPPEMASAAEVLHEIYLYNPKFFDSFDGIASHSYPNMGYIGTPEDSGEHSILGYQWELNYFKNLGINKTFPVFITETGWPHREGDNPQNSYYTANTAAQFILTALSIWNNDPQVKAVTPFIFNFPNPPFDHFSWLDKNSQLYPAYQAVTASPKTKNTPEQITSYKIIHNPLPWLIFPNQEYTGTITLENTGQSIWGDTKFCLTPKTSANVVLDALCTNDDMVPPGKSENFSYKFKISPADANQVTYLGWDDIGHFEIGLISGNPTIYHPKFNLKQQLYSWFLGLLNQL